MVLVVFGLLSFFQEVLGGLPIIIAVLFVRKLLAFQQRQLGTGGEEKTSSIFSACRQRVQGVLCPPLLVSYLQIASVLFGISFLFVFVYTPVPSK